MDFPRVQLSVVTALLAMAAFASDWPVLRMYEGEFARRVKMPVGGLGTGTVSVNGRGAFVDWEIANHPDKGYTPKSGSWAPQFAFRYALADGRRGARLLEGPVDTLAYEGHEGATAPNHGYPRFAKSVFKVAYPLAQVALSDPSIPLAVTLETMNPLVPGDAAASGIPAMLVRCRVKNQTKDAAEIAAVGTVLPVKPLPSETNGVVAVLADETCGTVTYSDGVWEPGWDFSVSYWWEQFVEKGTIRVLRPGDHCFKAMKRACLATTLGPGEEKCLTFAVAWRYPNRMVWTKFNSKSPDDILQNWYASKYLTAEAAGKDLLARLPELEKKTVAFVRSVTDAKVPDVVKEAALSNLSTLRSETCFRTADGRFFGWEGCFDTWGSCEGSCTHVWGYEHALVELWPDLAKGMRESEFVDALWENGRMSFRIGLPLAKHGRSFGMDAADGHMHCIVKMYETWRKTGDDAWMKKLYPNVRKAMAFAWLKGGWDGDKDGVMEGCQHNTMDVDYFGPNPQMEFIYLAALEAMARMADAAGDRSFEAECRALAVRGKTWTEQNLFNGEYYEQKIRPVDPAALEGTIKVRNRWDKDNPSSQLGRGCLIDQLVGDYSARTVGLPPVPDETHALTTLKTILKRNRHAPGDLEVNPRRSFVMQDEESLRMAWYPENGWPNVMPFPYFAETMTGFEYVVAAQFAQRGDLKTAERIVQNIRNRYDGRKRNPFDEAECGHHYARALAAWTVYQAFLSAKK